ncbi:hypothetical protein K438DRAFT_1757273 [Mycena galopus ATCC 62051]|nr:hypothetical protein K438DRAFT_1757273 [Mycena galopus ATCC 62051]
MFRPHRSRIHTLDYASRRHTTTHGQGGSVGGSQGCDVLCDWMRVEEERRLLKVAQDFISSIWHLELCVSQRRDEEEEGMVEQRPNVAPRPRPARDEQSNWSAGDAVLGEDAKAVKADPNRAEDFH